jgi:hypothetical protein
MTQLDIRENQIETSFKLDGNMLQYVQRICLKRFVLGRMYITDIDTQAFTTFANYSTCLESLEKYILSSFKFFRDANSISNTVTVTAGTFEP